MSFSIGTSNTGQTEIVDIGQLKYDFTLKSAESVINSIGLIPGAMSVTLYDELDTGLSAYDHISAELSGPSFTAKSIPVTMRFQPHGASTPNTFPFQIQYSGLQYDVSTGKLTLQLLPALQTSERYDDFFSNIQNTSPAPAFTNLRAGTGGSETNYVSYIAGDFITQFIRRIDPNGVSNVFKSGYNSDALTGFGVRFPEPGFGAPMTRTGYVFSNLSDVDASYDAQPVSSKVFSLAAMEGAIVGSAFSVNFYVNRMTNSINQSLSNNDTTALSLVQRERQVNAVNVTINTINVNNIFPVLGLQALPQAPVNRVGQMDGWLFGTQFVGLDLIAHAPQFGRGKSENDGSNTIANATATDSFINTDVANIAIAGAQAYALAFGSLQAPTYQEITTTVLGVTRIKPHEALTFDTTVPERFRNRHYRPSALSYDFKADTIDITAYEIP
jgi:hypothetical protein